MRGLAVPGRGLPWGGTVKTCQKFGQGPVKDGQGFARLLRCDSSIRSGRLGYRRQHSELARP